MSGALRESLARLVSFCRKGRWERELQQELQSHLELLTDDNMKAGMDETEARRHGRQQIAYA